MMTPEVISSLKKAYVDLLNAEHELNRPEEDVVTLSACHNIRHSMRQMLNEYLKAHDLPTNAQGSLSALLEASSEVNDAFGRVDVSDIECKGMGATQCDGKYCLAIENVDCCLKAANQVKDIVWKEFLF